MSRGIGRIRAVAAVLGVLVVLIGGAFGLGVLGAPAVTDVQNRFAGVSDTTTTIETDVLLTNPNPVGVQLGGVTVNYTVALNDVRLASGTKEGVNVSTGNSTIRFRTAMANERIPDWWVAHIRDGERSDLVVAADVTSATLGRTVSFSPVDREISTDLLSAFNSTETRPVNAERPLVSDPVLYINETGAAWGAVSEAETPMRLRFLVYNPKSAPYAVTGVGYDITMNGVPVGSGESERSYTIPPKSTREVRATTFIDNEKLDAWWVSHLERNQVTELRIDFYARIELPGGQEVRVPLDALTYTETVETDIFGNKDAAAGGGTTTTAEGGSTTTDGGSTTTSSTDTPTETTEETTTEETTTTTEETTTTTEDDGGLLP